MGRISNSIELMKSSWAVLKAEKELLVIPIVSFFATVVTVGLVGGGIFLSLTSKTEVVNRTNGFTTTPVESTTLAPTALTYVVGILGYLLVTFVVTFFAAALVAGAYQRLQGGDATLGSAFGTAVKLLGPIFLWSLLTGTVGLVLQALEERAGFLAQILLRGVGMAWRIVTWLAVPVIVAEGTGPFTSLKRSAHLFKKTWGENLIAQGGFGLIGFLAMIGGFVVFGAIATLVPIVGIALAVVWVGVVSTVMAALNGIYRTALYMYAAGQQTPWFDEQMMAAAFRPKTGILGR